MQRSPEVKPISVILQVGHIDAEKDIYDILEQTIAVPLNEGMQRIFRKFAVVHLGAERGGAPVVIASERPHAVTLNNNFIVLKLQAFIVGDLAFYATILGKPNMATCWCTWCMFSKASAVK